MAELTTAVNDLLKGKKAEENLKVYADGLSLLYMRAARLRLSMNYYTFAEIYSEQIQSYNKLAEDIVKRVQNLIERDVIGNDPSHDDEKEVSELRDLLISVMEAATAYTDRFQVYEYILNRVEYRFKEPEFEKSYFYGGDFERDIKQYLVNDKDNSVVNMKICQLVGQLPMRLSQNKFFDIINNSYSVYKTSDKSAVDDFTYMIRTAGLLHQPDNMDNDEFRRLSEINSVLKNADYDNITSEEFDKLRGLLDEGTTLVEQCSDWCVMLTECVNDIYAIILSGAGDNDGSEADGVKSLIGVAHDCIDKDIKPDSDAAMKFTEYEGLQEDLGRWIATPESTYDEIADVNKNAIAKQGLQNKFEALRKISVLRSSSVFAGLENSNDSEEAGEEYTRQAARKVTDEFSKAFTGMPRQYRRAVMASVVSNLPVFFNNLEEFQEYIHVAINQCSDEAEQQACMSLIRMMMSGD